MRQEFSIFNSQFLIIHRSRRSRCTLLPQITQIDTDFPPQQTLRERNETLGGGAWLSFRREMVPGIRSGTSSTASSLVGASGFEEC